MALDTASVVIGVALLASLAQGVTAFGFALISVPALVLVLDVKDTVVVVSLLALTSEVMLAFRVWNDVHWPTVGALTVGSWLGMPLGLIVLLRVPEDALRLLVGLAAIVLAGALAAGLRITARGLRVEFAVGALSGILQTSTSISGPPIVSYLVGRGLERDEFRGVMALYLLAGSIVAVGVFFIAGVVTRDAVLLALVGLPAVFVGNTSGNWLASRIDAAIFRRIVIALLMATALAGVGFSIQRLVA
jgi:uncharacterized membrane protein YfcA